MKYQNIKYQATKQGTFHYQYDGYKSKSEQEIKEEIRKVCKLNKGYDIEIIKTEDLTKKEAIDKSIELWEESIYFEKDGDGQLKRAEIEKQLLDFYDEKAVAYYKAVKALDNE